MKMKRASYAIYFVVLLCALALGSLEGTGTTPRLFLADEGFAKSPEIHEKVEWIHHRKQLIGKTRTIKDINFHLPQADHDGIKSTSFTKRIYHKAISLNAIPPRVREALLGCLKEKELMFQVLGQEISFEQFFVECIHLISSWPTSNKRFLLSDSSQALSSGLAPLVSSLTIASSSERAVEEAETSFSFGLEPNQMPDATHSKINSSTDASEDKFMVSNMISSSQFHEGSMHFPSSHPSEHHSPWKGRALGQALSEEEEVMEVIIVACAVTAIGTFFSVGLVFCCCLQRNNETINSGGTLRDDRPLLNLSKSDTSGGPSQMSNQLSSFNDKHSMATGSQKDPSFINKISMKHNDLLLGEPSSGDETTGAIALPLPPGRSVPAPALKPAPAPAPAPAPPPPGPPPVPGGPLPPPMPPNKGVRPPPMPPNKGVRPSPLGPTQRGKNAASSNGDESEGENGAPKAKLKPFFWDKVLASDDHSMVWHELQAGSFQFNEEMIESLFGYSGAENNRNNKKKTTVLEPKQKFIQIIDPRKAQNLSILLKALNVTTEEVINALKEGNELPPELLHTLLKTAPTTDEELKLRLYAGDPADLGPAEQFLKVVVEIPSAFKRVEALLFMSSLQEEVTNMKESFETLEVACNKLKNSRLFLKLLEAVLKTGNRMNDGTYRGGAQAFKLDTLLKLSDVKGTDGKITLLHFVVQEITRSEGIKALRAAKLNKTLSSVSSVDVVRDTNPDMEDEYRDRGLEVVSSLSNELQDFKKAAAIDIDVVAATVSKLGSSLAKNSAFLRSELKTNGEDNEFSRALSNFVERAEADVSWLAVEEERIMALVKNTADYFHGTAGTKEGLRLFSIVRDFLVMLDRVCKQIQDTRAKPSRPVKKGTETSSASSDKQLPSSFENRQPIEEMHKRLFPAIADQRKGGKGDWSSSSDSDSDSDSD